MIPTKLKIEATVMRMRHPKRYAAARQALYQKGVDNGAFRDSSGQAKIGCVPMWIVRPGDYGYSAGVEIVDGIRLYGEY